MAYTRTWHTAFGIDDAYINSTLFNTVAPKMSGPFGNPYEDHKDRLGSFDAFELVDAISTPPVVLIIGNERESLQISQGLLERIPYFQSCLRNTNFVETETKTFRLRDEDLKTVKQLLTWLVHPIDDHGTIQLGSMALLADKWANVDLRTSILKAAWAYWTTIDHPAILALKMHQFYEQAATHRIRFLALHFLSVRRGQGYAFPPSLMTNAIFCNDFAKWDWLHSMDSTVGDHDDNEPSWSRDLFRRVMNGDRVVLGGGASDAQDNRSNEWLDTYLNG